jgi:pilus assembly protein Flp/PilA
MGDAVEIGWKEFIMKTFLNMLRDDSGASAAEYALILAIVGTAIALAAIGLGNAVSGSMNNASDCIDVPSSC